MTSSLIFSSLHLTLDISYFISMLSLLIKIICTYAVVEIIYDKNKTLGYYEKLLVQIFVLQTFIQLLGYFYRPFSNFIVYFNHDYKLHSGYDGIRGNALSGAAGSGLGWAYGMAIILYTKIYLLETRKLNLLVVLMALLLFLGIFFSARTGFLGCILAVIYFIFSPNRVSYKIKTITYFSIFLIFILGIIYVAFYDKITIFIEKVLPYVFEFFYNKASKGRLETASTNVLLEMWGKACLITGENFLLGDGWFTDPLTGKYYHHVDVGYLRNMFYWGFIGTGINYFCQIFIFKDILLTGNKKEKRFVFYILACLFIIELKANVVSFGHITMIFCAFYILIHHKFKVKPITNTGRSNGISN
jgi:hypothetical protein